MEILELTLALFHCRGGHGPALARAVRQCGSVAVLFEATPVQKAGLGLSDAQLALLSPDPSVSACALRSVKADIERDREWAQVTGNTLLTYDSENYPQRLRETDCPPLVLYVRGDLGAVNALQLAIVGSRSASDYGKRNAYWMAHDLCAAGLTICSGMALGIDASAHRGALAATIEKRTAATVAVLGTGIDRVYPARHKALMEEIAAVGAVVSEFPLGTRAYAHNFPRRNRLISGLSAGVLVVEAALKSGSLITARIALEQNRDVYALPSLLSNPQGRGCHALIKQGAMLVDEPADILQEFGLLAPPCPSACPSARPPQHTSSQPAPRPSSPPWHNYADGSSHIDGLGRGLPTDLGALQRHLLQRLRTEECLFDSLLDADLAPFTELNNALLDLEVRGLVACRAGRYSIA